MSYNFTVTIPYVAYSVNRAARGAQGDRVWALPALVTDGVAAEKADVGRSSWMNVRETGTASAQEQATRGLKYAPRK
jgi:sirohydrochlorin ferrochelatase